MELLLDPQKSEKIAALLGINVINDLLEEEIIIIEFESNCNQPLLDILTYVRYDVDKLTV